MRKLCVLASGLLVLVALSIPATARTVEPGSDGAAIVAVANRWMDAYREGDLEALMSVYCDDMILALHDQPMRVGKAAVRDFFDDTFSRTGAEMIIDLEQLRVRGNVAYFVSKYWLTVGEGKDELRDAGRSLLVFEKQADGEWLLCADIDQATPDVVFPAPGMSDYDFD